MPPLEAALQDELDNYASYHPGYDEYNFDLDSIEHDPYVLISILTAYHQGRGRRARSSQHYKCSLTGSTP